MLTAPAFAGAMPAGGEYNYVAAEIVALREHLQWGTQVVWSYGPLGYLNEPAYFDFDSWIVAFGVNLLAHIGLFAVIAFFLARVRASRWVYVLVSVAILLTFDRYPGHAFARFPVLDHKVAIATLLLLFLATMADRESEEAVLAAIAGVAIGFLLVDKGTFLVVGASQALIYAVMSVAARRLRSVAALGGALVATFAGLWVLAGQSLLSVPAYLRTMYEIVAGYSPAMSDIDFSGTPHPIRVVLVTVALLAGGVAIALLAARLRDWPAVRFAVLAAPLIALQYKNSFGRFDGNRAIEFWGLFAVVLALFLARQIAAGALRKPPAWLAAGAAAACIVLVGGLGFYIGGLKNFSTAPATMRPTFLFVDKARGYGEAASLVVDAGARAREDDHVLASMRDSYPLPQDVVDALRAGTVDVVPYDLQAAFAYRLDWDPAPVWLAYSAYTPYLDHLNAEHYLGADAPAFVLFRGFAIDARYPLFDEPEAYRALFARYDVYGQAGDYVVLKRRRGAAPQPLTAAGSANGRMGDWIPVPAHGGERLFGRLQVHYSLLGRVMNLLDGAPMATIRFEYGNGQVSPPYRYVPTDGPDGVDLSAYAPDTASIARLIAGQVDEPIRAIQVSAHSPSSAYDADVSVDYFTTPVS